MMLRSSDSMTYEDGYQWLQGYLESHLHTILALMEAEEDAGVRSKLVELLGDSKAIEAIPFLERELLSQHREVRSWAYSSLVYFGNDTAEQVAIDFRTKHPDEDFL